MTFVIPLLFVLLYALGALCRLTPPDWQLTELMLTLPSAEQLQLPAALAPMLPKIYLGMGVVLAVVLGPTLYALTMLPNEFGWRGYLLPRLMLVGRWPAYILSGIFWWLSFLPLVLWRGGTPLVNALLSLGMAVTLSAASGEVWRRSQHLGLTAVCSGCLVCQASSIWLYLFPTINTGFPWPSRFGPVALVVFAVVAVVPGLLFGGLEPKAEDDEKKAPK
jgi:hypothetical protein